MAFPLKKVVTAFRYYIVGLGMAMVFFACPEKPCTNCLDGDVIIGEYNPVDFHLNFPEWLPEFEIPADNPLTEQGIALGRRLFYDPILSGTQTTSCNSCHQLDKSFSDGLPVSLGDSGQEGSRGAMALINLGFNQEGFYSDGRVASLEEEVISSVEDPLMLNAEWTVVLDRLRQHDDYPVLFRNAFGIERTGEITKELVAKAVASFERTLVSYDSRYDQVVWENDGWFLNAEERGKALFFKEDSQEEEHPGCSHCHIPKYFTDNSYRNNGLDFSADLLDFPDAGRGSITGNVFDNGKFRVPTLRNIEMTAPYMHDGRFESLEEVLEHYSAGGHGSDNEDINIKPFSMTEMQKQDLIAFLKTLTDTEFLDNSAFKSPF